MYLDRKYNTVRNSIWGIVNRTIAILGPFVIRTMIIRLLGQDYLGLNSLFTSILQVLSLAELGFSSAIAYSMYKPIAENNEQEICSLLNLFKKFYRLVGSIILVIGLLLLPLLRFLIKGDAPENINIYGLYIMFLLNTCVSYLMYAYYGVLFSAYQREDVISKMHSFVTALQYIVQIVVLIAFRNYYIYYIVVPIATVFNNIFTKKCAEKIYPQYIPYGKVEKETLKDIKEKLAGVSISKFCGVTRNSFDSIIISALLGLNVVAVYSNYYYILSNVSAMIVIFVSSMRAGIGNSMVLETEEKNHNDFHKFTFMYMWLAGWCTVCLLCLYQPFMEVWVGKNGQFSINIVILFSIYFYGLCAGDIIDAYSGAAGLWWENRYRTVFESVSNIILNVVLGYYFGVFGVVLATVLTVLVFNFLWKLLILYRYCFKSYTAGDYIVQSVKYALVISVAAYVTFFFCELIKLPTWINLFLRGVICLVVPNMLLFVFYRKNINFHQSKEMISGIVKRFRGEKANGKL